ncbi:MAG: helix-turn-helix domain-containing protein [Deltaproteobacteria bacterium]|nr:helix-turn-helix domain-containing protein [Deltaproteobacteria bacterium]
MPKAKPRPGETENRSAHYLSVIGESVRKLRERQGMTLRQLAALSGLSDRFIIAVEKGVANPSVTSLVQLAEGLKISLVDLLSQAAPSRDLEPQSNARKIADLLDGRPQEQIARVLSCLSMYLKEFRGLHVALVGMRGAGKTTVGRHLARVLRMPFYELDEFIEIEAGLSLNEVFRLEGESYYRTLEGQVLQRTLRNAPGIIAAGGGLVMNPTNLLRLKLHSFVVWLRASPETLIERVRATNDERALRNQRNIGKQLKTILAQRTPYYSQADFVINTTNKTVEAVGRAIVQALGKPGLRPEARHKSEKQV